MGRLRRGRGVPGRWLGREKREKEGEGKESEEKVLKKD